MRSFATHTHMPIITILVGCLIILPAATALADDDAPHITNTSPSKPARTVELEELWRVGGEDEDLLLGLMIASNTDEDKNVYLLDNQLCQVIVLSPEGEYLRTLSRQGEGPGEVNTPMDLLFTDDGNIALVELFPGKFVTITPEGVPVGEITIGGDSGPQTGFTATVNATKRGGTLMVSGQRTAPSDNGQKRNQYLTSLAETGEEIARFCETSMVLDFSAPIFRESEFLPAFFLANAVGPDGRVFAAMERDQYAIAVYNGDGTLEMVIEREFKNRKRTAQETGRMNALIDAWFAGTPFDIEREVDEIEPIITALHVDNTGNLWVQHSRSTIGQPDGVLVTYDVFDPQGQYLQEVSVVCEGDPLYDGLQFLDDGRVLLIKGYVLALWTSRGAQNVNFDEDGGGESMEVICCGSIW